MSKIETRYADAALTINFSGHMVRVIFGDLNEMEENESYTPHTKLILPLRGFVSMVESCNKMIEKMKETDVLIEKTDEE